MPENNMDRPLDTATNNAKAEWSATVSLSENPEGMSKDELVRRVRADWPDGFEGYRGKQAVGAALEHLKRAHRVHRDASIQKWKSNNIPELAIPQETEEEVSQREREWYQPVANQLVDSGLCTSATPSGDDLNGAKWTNPDVVGLIKPEPHAQVLNFTARLVAVEIKRATDPLSLLTGFAEACAYLDFAHISWLIVPWCDGETVERVERLCVVHGLGIAYVHEEKQENEENVLWLEIGVRPRYHEPGLREFADFIKRLDNKDINI